MNNSQVSVQPMYLRSVVKFPAPIYISQSSESYEIDNSECQDDSSTPAENELID